MDKFNEIKRQFRKRGKRCGHVGGIHETHHGLILSCCNNFNRTCAPRAFDDMERVIIDLCHENERLKLQLAAAQERSRPTVTNNFVQNNIYVQNNVIGVRGDDILQIVRKFIKGGGDRSNMYASIANLIAVAPQSENRDRTLSLIRSGNGADAVEAEMKVHSAFMDAINEVNPADAEELDAFMEKDYGIIESKCQDLGIELVEDLPEDVAPATPAQPGDTKKRKVAFANVD